MTFVSQSLIYTRGAYSQTYPSELCGDKIPASDYQSTITDTYNVLEKLQKNEELTAWDRQAHEQGLVSVLRQIHDDLDAAVAEVYGWSSLSERSESKGPADCLQHWRPGAGAAGRRGKICCLRQRAESDAISRVLASGRCSVAKSANCAPYQPLKLHRACAHPHWRASRSRLIEGVWSRQCRDLCSISA
jgi:hypothetical protein